jgi:hypothetical protein
MGKISHHSVACMKTTRTPWKYRRCKISHHSVACMKMTRTPRKYRKFEASHPFYCVLEVDGAS